MYNDTLRQGDRIVVEGRKYTVHSTDRYFPRMVGVEMTCGTYVLLHAGQTVEQQDDGNRRLGY